MQIYHGSPSAQVLAWRFLFFEFWISLTVFSNWKNKENGLSLSFQFPFMFITYFWKKHVTQNFRSWTFRNWIKFVDQMSTAVTAGCWSWNCSAGRSAQEAVGQATQVTLNIRSRLVVQVDLDFHRRVNWCSWPPYHKPEDLDRRLFFFFLDSYLPSKTTQSTQTTHSLRQGERGCTMLQTEKPLHRWPPLAL